MLSPGDSEGARTTEAENCVEPVETEVSEDRIGDTEGARTIDVDESLEHDQTPSLGKQVQEHDSGEPEGAKVADVEERVEESHVTEPEHGLGGTEGARKADVEENTELANTPTSFVEESLAKGVQEQSIGSTDVTRTSAAENVEAIATPPKFEGYPLAEATSAVAETPQVVLVTPTVEETDSRADVPVVEVVEESEIVEAETISVPLTPPAANQRTASLQGVAEVTEVVTVPLTPPTNRVVEEYSIDDGLPIAEVVSMSTAAPIFRPPLQTGNVPPAIVPPRGLAGLFDDYDPEEIMDTSKFSKNAVLLNVYDVGSSEDELVHKVNKIGTGNNNLLVGGVFHAGVEVYGVEWMYGYSAEGNTGVCSTLPRMNPQHTYRTTVPLGKTKMSEEEVKGLLTQMADEWRGQEYHLLHRNCLNFSRELCKELGVRHVPGWVDRASRAGSFIDHSSRSVADTVRQTATLARSISNDVQELASSMATDLDRTFRGETDPVENLASVGEAVRRQSAQALEAVAETDFSRNAQELTEVAAAKAQVIHETVVAKTRELGESAQELLGEDLAERAQETAQVLSQTVQAHSQAVVEVAQDIHADLADQAQVLHEKAQEHAQVLSQNFFKWGAELRQAASRVLGDESADRGSQSRDPWGLLPVGGFLSSSGRVEMDNPSTPGYLAPNHSRSTNRHRAAEADGTAIAVDDQE